MPTYQYRCQACTSELEVWQKFTDDALTTCAECGGPLRKIFNAVGIVFKGSGFYATDSRKADSAAKPASTAGDPAIASSTKSDSGSSGDSSKASSKDTAAA